MSENNNEHTTHALQDPLFQRELHRLLWIPAIINDGEMDAGWSCRDHAVVTGLLLALENEHPEIVNGRNMFVQGPSGNLPPVGIGQELHFKSGHTWLDVPAKGIIDLSPILGGESSETLSQWRSIEFGGIVFDDWLPSGGGKLIKCDSPKVYVNETNKATHVEEGVTAIYFEQRREKVSFDGWIKAAQQIDSPLSDRVYRDHGKLAYIAAVAHLKAFLTGRSRAIAGLSQNKAWKFILSRYPDPLAAIHSMEIKKLP